MTPKPRAFATYLSNRAYLDGCLVLAYSLRKVGSKYPLVVMYPNHLDPSVLDELRPTSNIILQNVDTEPWQFNADEHKQQQQQQEQQQQPQQQQQQQQTEQQSTPPGSPLRLPSKDTTSSASSSAYLWAHYSDTWSKLAVWSLVEYDRVVLLDSDMLVRQPKAELGDPGTVLDLAPGWIAASHACTCNPLRIKAYPASWTPDSCAYTQHSGNPCPPAYHDQKHKAGQTEIEESNTPGATAAHSLPSPDLARPKMAKAEPQRAYFNSGLVVLTPSWEQYSKILSHFQTVQDLRQYRFPDQDLLNKVFECRWKSLGYGFNALKTLKFAHSPVWNDQVDELAVKEEAEARGQEKMKVLNIHYILEKPWDVKDLETAKSNGNQFVEGYQWWWQAYNELQAELKSL
ncbi:hypothetical protein BGX26_001890 [Mortierella sp. AD094]|nr:hypothetical protein BGX26_001890 [Mortierella sp. AD094]